MAAITTFFVAHAALGDETISETLDAFGFSGSFARHCDQPASPDNNLRVVTRSPVGDPIFTESLGGNGEPNVYAILAAHSADDRLTLRIKLNGDTEQDLTMRRDGERLRTVSNRDVKTGKYVVRNGVVLSTKRETPWLARCPQTPG